MVRTRGENTGRRVVGAKAPRKQLAGGTSISSPGSKDKQGGGNPVRWTPTPSWQKGIGNFFQKCNASNGENSNEPENDTTSDNQIATTGHEPSSEITSLEE